jgi:hypothetical protein
MTRTAASLGALLLAGLLGAQSPPSTPKNEKPSEVLRVEIEALKPAQHIWRAIPWKTCPLEALNASREQKKPVIAWVFLGVPTDERC